jgi:hypothetical protein
MGRLLIEKGLGLVLTRNHHGTVCRFMPPLNVGNAGLKKKPKKLSDFLNLFFWVVSECAVSFSTIRSAARLRFPGA